MHFLRLKKILCSKKHLDSINDLQYHGDKIAIVSEMSLKMGLKFDFERYTSVAL